MATGFSFANIFRPTQQVSLSPNSVQPPASPPQPQGQPGPNPGNTAGTQGPNNGPGSSMQQGSFNGPGTGGQQPQGTNTPPQSSPLDGFAELWKTNANPDSTGSGDPFTQPLFSTDPAKIREAASQIDFLQAVPQELMQKAMSGNDPQSFMQVMNAVAQNALATALQVSTQTVEQAGSKIGERFNKALPNRFKDLQITSAQPTNPVLSHPAVQPMLNMVRNQIKMANPDATPQQVNQMAEDYLSKFAGALQPQSGSSNGGGEDGMGSNNGNFDWEQWATTMPKGANF